VLTGAVASSLSLAGATSGTCSLTAPAVAGTITNPFTISNSLQFPSGTVINWNADSGLSRDTAGQIDVGNGTAGNKSGFINFAGFSVNSGGNIIGDWNFNRGGTLGLNNTQVIAFTNSAAVTSGWDTGLSRDAAGVIDVGTGLQGSKAGTLNAQVVNVNTFPASRTASINVTPITVNANVSTAQNLMSFSIPATQLNGVGKTLKVWCAGVYSTPAASVATINISVTLGALVLLSITSSANPGTVTNNAWNLNFLASVQTAGATAALESHGILGIDLGAATTSADTFFNDTNIATVSSVDLTASQTLQVTITFSVASGSNSATQRQLVVEFLN